MIMHHIIEGKHSRPSWTLAGPSFVWPAPVGENCRLLQGLVQEVSLIFFETQACLDYTAQDLPLDLATLGLSYHLHLPLDLPWHAGATQVAKVIERLGTKVDFLQPWAYVMHPPACPQTFLEFWKIFSNNKDHPLLLLENIEQNSLNSLWPLILENDIFLCLDLGHLLVYNQKNILQAPKLFEKIKMLHIYGELSGHKHAPLNQLSKTGQGVLHWLLKNIAQDCVLVFEVFNLEDLKQSLSIFSQWLREWKICPTSEN